jgi:uncharacterized membrane-anchored protein
MDTNPASPSLFISPRTLRVATMVGAASLFAFGVFAWIAANWSDFHRLAKLGLVAALLLAATLTAAQAPRTRTPALLVASAAIGALLALVGQIYPSGADAWQLFAAWTVLALPFALAARHEAVWLLWALVASVAIGLWQQQERGGIVSIEFGEAWTLAIALALVLAPLAPLRAIIGRADWAFRLASLSAVALITVTGFIGLFDSPYRDDAGALAGALLALSLAATALVRMPKLELGVLTLVCAGLDALLIGLLFKALIPNDTSILAMLVSGLIAAAIVGGSVVLLRMVHARHAPPRDVAADSGEFSWPLAALSGFGALLAAAPFVILYGLVFGENPASAAFNGLLALGFALFLLRDGAPFGFRQMFGFITVVTSFLLIGYAVIDAVGFADSGFLMAGAAALAAAFTPVRWMRALLGFAALPALAASTLAQARYALNIEPTLVVLMVAAGAAMLLFVTERSDAQERWQPFFSGWTAAGLFVLMLFAGHPFLISAGAAGDLSEIFLATGNNAMLVASTMLGIAGIALLLWRRPELRTPLGFAVATCAVALTLRAPTLGAAIVIFTIAVLVESRSLVAAATLAMVWIISTFYYALSWSLTEKAYVLMTLGAALGLVIFLTRARSDGAVADRARLASTATALIAFGAAATLGVAGVSVYGAEQVLREGRIVYLALRPVDPRSLLQGDYMALAFNTDNLPSPYDIRGTALALAEVDAHAVATLQTLLPANMPAAPNQILLRLRSKSERWFVGSDAFYFEEGTGAAYESAKYGQFRVGKRGRMLLTGLADAELKLLP